MPGGCPRLGTGLRGCIGQGRGHPFEEQAVLEVWGDGLRCRSMLPLQHRQGWEVVGLPVVPAGPPLVVPRTNGDKLGILRRPISLRVRLG